MAFKVTEDKVVNLLSNSLLEIQKIKDTTMIKDAYQLKCNLIKNRLENVLYLEDDPYAILRLYDE